MDWLSIDLRSGLRAWRRKPGSAALCILTLAVGISCNVAAFSFVRALLFQPYPFRDLDRLVLLRETRTGDVGALNRVTTADVLDLQSEGAVFEEIAVYRFEQLSLTGPFEPVRVRSFAVTANLFPMLGIHAALGRVFARGEDEPGADRAAILSHGLWQRRWGGAPNVVGTEIVLNGRSHTVVGVMPWWFSFPRGVEIWTPLALTAPERTDRLRATVFALARIGAGDGVELASERAERFSERLADRHPGTNRGRKLTLLPLREEQYQYTLPFFTMLQLTALLALLVAAANASNVFLSEQIARRGEHALRLAFGASRRQVFANGLLEGLMLAAIAAALAVPLSWWTVRAARQAMPREIAVWVAGWDLLEVDGAVLAFAVVVVLAAGVFLGWAGRAPLRRDSLASGLKEERLVVPANRRRARGFLAAVQIAVALILASAALSMLSGFRELLRVFNGLEPDGVLTFGAALLEERYGSGPPLAEFFGRAFDALSSLPSVEAVGAVANLPASNVPNASTGFSIESRPPAAAAEMPSADLQTVGGEFFRVFRLPVRAGRSLAESDGPDGAPVVVISEAMARRHWRGEDPLGQRIRLGRWGEGGPWWTIVGVAADIKQNWFDPEPRPIVYVSYRQRPARFMSVALRTTSEPHSLTAPVRERMAGVDAAQALSEMESLRKVIDDSLAPLRIIGWLVLGFASVTLALASVGLYGVLGSYVADRRREMGVRLALGASPWRLLARVLGENLRLAGIAVLAALPLSLVANALLGARLFGLAAVDAVTVVALALSILFVSLLSALAPARRAASIDPALAIRLG
jgi:putative ABC transport system permease protein